MDDFRFDSETFGVSWSGLLLAPFFHFLLLLLPYVTNYVKEYQLRKNMASTSSKKAQLSSLKKEQSLISMTDEFAKHAKLQRRINVIQDELAQLTHEATTKAVVFKTRFQTVARGLVFLCLISTITYHRSMPLFLLPPTWFGPLNWFISFPTGIPGAVGFTFWLVTCRRIMNSIHDKICSPPKDDTSDQNLLSNLINSMRGSSGVARGGTGNRAGSPFGDNLFPTSGAFPTSPIFPGLTSPTGPRQLLNYKSDSPSSPMMEPTLD